MVRDFRERVVAGIDRNRSWARLLSGRRPGIAASGDATGRRDHHLGESNTIRPASSCAKPAMSVLLTQELDDGRPRMIMNFNLQPPARLPVALLKPRPSRSSRSKLGRRPPVHMCRLSIDPEHDIPAAPCAPTRTSFTPGRKCSTTSGTQ